MRVADADALERRDDAIEFSHIRTRSDAHPVHPAPRNFIVAYEHFAIAAAAQFFHETLGVLRIAEGACLDKERAGDGNC